MLKAKVSGTSDVAGVHVYDADGRLLILLKRGPPESSTLPIVHIHCFRSGSSSEPYQIELVRSRLSGAPVTLIARK